MYKTSADFKQNIVDGETRQNFLLMRVEKGEPLTGYFSAIDGDFTLDGVVLEQGICKTEELTFGGTPAGSASFGLMNPGKVLQDYPWGNMVAYIGVKVGESSFSVPSGALSYVLVGSTAYTGKSDGVYRGSTRVYNSNGVPITGLVADPFGNRVIALGEGVCVSVPSSGTATAMTPSRHLARKLMNGVSCTFYEYAVTNGAVLRQDIYDLEEGIVETYEYVNMGMYVVSRPDSLQNSVVSVSDANNVLSLLDVDATNYITGLTYPVTIRAFTLGILNALNIDVIEPASTAWSETISANPFENSSYTLRDLLGFVAERIGRTIAFDGCVGSHIVPTALKFIKPCDSKTNYVESVSYDRLEAQSLAVKDYETPAITKIQLKKSDGETVVQNLSRVAGDAGVYQISGNPLITSISAAVQDGASGNGYSFHPTNCSVISADPSVELGDMTQIAVSENATEDEYDVYGRPTGGTVTNDPVVIPLMSRTIHWQGNCFADYQATGGKARQADKSASVYRNASSQLYTDITVKNFDGSLDQESVFNRLTNNGTAQGIYMSDGDLYINGTFIRAETIQADALETTDGISWLAVLNEFLGLALGDSTDDFLRLGDWKVFAKEVSGNPSGNYITFAPNTVGGVSFSVYPAGHPVTYPVGSQNSVTSVVDFVGGGHQWSLTEEEGFIQIS